MFIVAKVLAGSTIEEAVGEAMNLSLVIGIGVQFEFNGVMVDVTSADKEEDIIEKYEKEQRTY